MIAAHTPGPWHLVSERRSQGNGKRGFPNSDTGPQFLVCGPAGATVITRRGLAKPSKPEGQANARLIAAAPELLEAALAVLCQQDNPVRDGKTKERFGALRAAIAKATGAGQ